MAIYQIIPSTGKFFRWVREHKTDIMTYGGLTLMTGSVVAAAVGTKNMIKEKEETKNEEKTPVKEVVDCGKHYIPTVVTWGIGGYLIHKSHGIEKATNAALSNTIAAMATSTLAYRERWRDKVGEDEEKKIFFDEKTEEVETVDENGKTKKSKVKTSAIDPNATTAVYFDQECSWMADDHGDIDLDMRTVKNVMAMLNQRLRGDPDRILFINEVYDALGEFTINKYGQRVNYRCAFGQNVGWIYDKENPVGDNTVLITITKTNRKLDDGRVIPTLRLEFNHDGNILEHAKERGLLK